MPIEVFPGKTGPRLLPILPVSDGSYAVVRYEDEGGSEREFHASWQGAHSSGWPVLSPVLSTIERDVLRWINAERLAALHHEVEYFNEERYPPPDYRGTREAATQVIVALCKMVPILTSIKVGERLRILVPELTTSRHLLGPVTGWEIFNT